jgi:hypothetical protein
MQDALTWPERHSPAWHLDASPGEFFRDFFVVLADVVSDS